MHCHDNRDDLWIEFNRRREEWRARRDAQREAWRSRRAERRSKWAHLADPAFWGLDEDSLRRAGMAGMNPGAGNVGMGCFGGAGSQEADELKARVASMEETIVKLNERIIVLEKLALASDDVRLAAEIEKLRGKGDS